MKSDFFEFGQMVKNAKGPDSAVFWGIDFSTQTGLRKMDLSEIRGVRNQALPSQMFIFDFRVYVSK